jgi:hypothetical protein
MKLHKITLCPISIFLLLRHAGIFCLLLPHPTPPVHRVNDDGAGDGKNSKIVQKLMPDKDYYLQIQTFDPKGGKFEFSITAW